MSWETKTENKKEVTVIDDTIEFQSLADAKENRGLKILCYGDFGTGKTHFALSSPNPYVIDTENGASPLADKFPSAKSIMLQKVNLPKEILEKYDDKEECNEILNWYRLKKLLDVIEDNKIPDDVNTTIIIDSSTDIWAFVQAYIKDVVFKLDVLAKVKQQFDWGTINGEHNRLVMRLINRKNNIIFTARANEIYSGPGQPSGQYQPATQKKLPYFVDAVLYHTNRFNNGKFEFSARITKFRQHGELVGKVVVNPTFNKLNEMIKNGK